MLRTPGNQPKRSGVYALRRNAKLLVRRLVVAVVCLLLPAAGCTGLHAPRPSEREVESPQTEAESEAFSFNEMVALLDERNILVEPLLEQDEEGLLTQDVFATRLEQRMDRYPRWHVLSTHLAMVRRFPLIGAIDQPMYVAEITGPRTGNCFDLYYATDGEYWGSACFYPTRG